MSAVLSCGNVDFGVATPLQQYKETYRIAHTCDTTPQNIMAEKINIKLLIEEITKSHVIWMLQAKTIVIKTKRAA